MICGHCGAVGKSFPRLKSGLVRCGRCYLRMQESNRAATEDELGVCAWPRAPITLPALPVSAALPAPDSQDTVTVGELAQRALARSRALERWKNRPPAAADLKAQQTGKRE